MPFGVGGRYVRASASCVALEGCKIIAPSGEILETVNDGMRNTRACMSTGSSLVTWENATASVPSNVEQPQCPAIQAAPGTASLA